MAGYAVHDDVDRFTAKVGYTCACKTCGRTLKREVVVERYISGAYTDEQFSALVRSQAETEAMFAAEDEHICRQCEIDGPKWLLIEMAADDKVRPAPTPFKGSHMHNLHQRGLVEEAHERCDCGSPCCGGWRKIGGYKVSWKGRQHAKKYKK
ncbi:hypothetical protein HOT99_gp286 [Caulobacter phage CcrBL10]|uniref:Uncharacterized protein n=1 Tax=Caulobacter phage CcrBL10 TaxID=2283269 RepID=A0A385E907_9CAUD|nr:hypothetical protein HOT99_gp286 [Caulobacter phage CcrBL10]AXQ68331.1 hypothetical protein CcrBL10_gp127c [Caulobacter phage CcrBL10]